MAKKIDHDERREIFAAAALRVIMRRGIGGVTVREVAKEAGFTTGALTHYFRSKDQVLIEASEHSAKLVRPMMDQHLAEMSGLEALRQMIYEILPHNAKMRGYWRIWVGFWERSSYNPDVARVMRLRYSELRGRLGKQIKRAQTEGDIAAESDPDEVAQGLIALIDGIGVQVRLGAERISTARQHELVDSWLAMITARKAPEKKRAARKAS